MDDIVSSENVFQRKLHCQERISMKAEESGKELSPLTLIIINVETHDYFLIVFDSYAHSIHFIQDIGPTGNFCRSPLRSVTTGFVLDIYTHHYLLQYLHPTVQRIVRE